MIKWTLLNGKLIKANIKNYLRVSKNCENVFGINDVNMIGRSINEFMPNVIARHHDSILHNFYNTGVESTINNIMHTWGLN